MRRRHFSHHVVQGFLALTVFIASTASASAGSVTLAWDAPVDGVTTGYTVLYGTAPGAYTSRINVGFVSGRRIEGLTTGVRYYFSVQAYSATGETSDLATEVSGIATDTAPPPPPPPSPPPPSGGGGGESVGGGSSGGGGSSAGTGATGASPAGVSGAQTNVIAAMRDGRFLDIEWLPLNDVSSYRVEVGNASAATTFSAITPNAAIAFDTNLMPSAAYFVRVRPIIGGVPGASSNEEAVAGSMTPRLDVSTNTPFGCVEPPAPPRQFTAGANGSQVHLAWQASSTGAPASYLLQVGSAPGLSNLMNAPLPATMTALNATAANGFYALRLVAVNDCGPSVWGAEALLSVGGVVATVATPVPPAPVGLTGQVNGTVVSLTWVAPAGGGVTRYLVEATTDAGPVSLDTGNAATAFAHPNTPPGRYVITVRAGNAAGFGPPSNPVTVIVP